MYFLDIGKPLPGLNETDTIIAEDISYNRDLLRGYTTSRITMIQYEEFLKEIIGKYVEILTKEYNVNDRILSKLPGKDLHEKCENIALSLHEALFDGETSSATCPEIVSYKIENGYVIATDSMIEQSTSLWTYEDILHYIVIIFDTVFKDYLPSFYNDERMVVFRQFILDGLLARKEDFYYDGDGKYWFDIYGILKFYMIKKLFLGVNVDL